MSEDIKALLEQQGEAFDAFKASHEEQINELKKGINDPVLAERLKKVEGALDTAVEAKAALEAKIEAERKEREEMELRFSRKGVTTDEKKSAHIADFDILLSTLAAEQKNSHTPLSEDGYDQYKAAFNRFMRKNDRQLTPEEVKTLSVGSDPDGGYFVTPDVSGRIVNKVYETSPMRQIASVQQISTDKLEGIEDLEEAGAGYAGETSQGSDATTPQVGKWSIPVYWIDTEPKTTQQLLDDAVVDIEAWLANKVADKFARFENAEFVAGSQGKIRGLTSYATAADDGSGVAWGTFGHVATGQNGGFATSNPGDKIFDLIGTVKDAYLANSRFLTRRSVITAIRKFKDGQGNYLWQPSFVLGTPETIAAYPVTRAEDMPALATGALSMAFGDFREAYQIVDRQGIRVLRDPYTAKPYIKFYTTKRTGGGAVNFEAVKFMKFGS